MKIIIYAFKKDIFYYPFNPNQKLDSELSHESDNYELCTPQKTLRELPDLESEESAAQKKQSIRTRI